MSDLIHRQDALDILYDFAGCIVDTPGGIYNKAYREYRNKLESLPSAEKTGEWLEINNGLDTTCECSVCHYKDYLPNIQPDVMCGDRYWFHRNYCPNCGAKMKESDERLLVHGKWEIERTGNGWNEWAIATCSNCGSKYENWKKPFNFCPHCGSKNKAE